MFVSSSATPVVRPLSAASTSIVSDWRSSQAEPVHTPTFANPIYSEDNDAGGDDLFKEVDLTMKKNNPPLSPKPSTTPPSHAPLPNLPPLGAAPPPVPARKHKETAPQTRSDSDKSALVEEDISDV